MKILNAIRIFAFALTLLISGCLSTAEQGGQNAAEGDNQNKMEETAFRQAAEQRLNGQIEYLWNDSRSHVLCIQHNKTKTREDAMHSLSPFIIYAMAEAAVIYEDRPAGAKIQWVSDTVVHISLSPGMVHGDEENNPQDNGYYYDVVKQQKSYQSPKK